MTTKTDPAENVNDAACDNHGNTGTPHAESPLPSGEKHQPEARAHDANSGEGRKHWLEYATAGFALVAALGSVSAVIVGYWQWGIMDRTLVASQRPWIPGKFWVASDLIFSEKQAQVTIGYTLQNVGNTVATSVELYPQLFPFRVGKVDGKPPSFKIIDPQTQPLKELKIFCDQRGVLASDKFAKVWLHGESIFPNDSTDNAVTVSMTTEDMAVAASESAYGIFFPIFNACIVYGSPIEARAHETGYSFMLVHLDPKSAGGAREIDPKGSNIPKAELSLRKFPFQSGFAN